MRNLILIFLLLHVLVGCNILTKPDANNVDTVLNCFTCDSTGVHKSIFGRYEAIGFGVTVKNVSGKPLDYRRVIWSETLFDIACAPDVDSIMPGVDVGFPPEAWGDFILQPDEQLEQIQIYPPFMWLPAGNCKALFSFRFDFNITKKKYSTYSPKTKSDLVKFIIMED